MSMSASTGLPFTVVRSAKTVPVGRAGVGAASAAVPGGGLRSSQSQVRRFVCEFEGEGGRALAVGVGEEGESENPELVELRMAWVQAMEDGVVRLARQVEHLELVEKEREMMDSRD